MIHVCSLARLHATVEETGARHIVTLVNADTDVPRPECVLADDHLFLGMHDIVEELAGYTAPTEEHAHALIAFVRRWPRQAPLVVHCYAGISRSTAAAFIAACAVNPARDEASIAQTLRQLSPTAIPNARLISHADRILGRQGRMIRAIDGIGRGTACYEGMPFRLDLEP